MSLGARIVSWPLGASLRSRLVLIICTIISVILMGQAIVGLAGEVTELDARVATRGTILAQTVAGAVEPTFDRPEPERFDGVIVQLRRSVDLVSVALVDRDGLVVGHSDPARLGTVEPGALVSTFNMRAPVRGLMHIFDEKADYRVTAPIQRGDRLLGFVRVHYRSDEIARRAVFIMGATGGWALLWLLIGGGAATIYVRHITRPLALLTEAASAFSDDRLLAAQIPETEATDEIGTLQRAFRRLLSGLEAERIENANLLDQLHVLNSGLQDRVAAVTADLRAAHDHLAAVFGALEEGVVSCTLGGTIVQLNGAVARQLAGLVMPAVGQDLGGLFPSASAEIRRAFDEMIESGRGVSLEVEVEVEAQRETGGQRRVFVLRCMPMHGENRALRGGVLTFWDETERRRLDDTLRRQDRLASLGTLAAGLAHELGNHMHIIQGFAKVLLKRLAPDAEIRDDLEAIHEENRRAVDLLRRFLQFARPEDGRFLDAEVGALVRESLSFCRVELRAAGVTVEDHTADSGEAPQTIRCDPHLLQQVFINLALNAADAMRERPDRRLVVTQLATASGVEISFRDSGQGVPLGLRDRIFDPFFTTKPTGTGLGLAIAARIITAHGGRLSLFSEPGAGATFVVALPSQTQPAETQIP